MFPVACNSCFVIVDSEELQLTCDCSFLCSSMKGSVYEFEFENNQWVSAIDTRNTRSNRPQMFFKVDFRKDFAMFTGTHLC